MPVLKRSKGARRSFRLTAESLILTGNSISRESMLETAGSSLRPFVPVELTRPRISLPLGTVICYGRRLPGLQFGALTPPFNLSGHGQASDPIRRLCDFAEPCVFSKQSPPPGLLPPPKLASERASFSRNFGGILPSLQTIVLSSALDSLPVPCVG